MNQPNIEVNLIAVTSGQGLTAEQVLVYTKATRLEQGAGTRQKVANMTDGERETALAYMAGTIPSSWEFLDYTFEILNVTRAFTHQLVRTRTGSYAQQTMRMIDKRDFTYRIPPRLMTNERTAERGCYEACMAKIQESYDTLIVGGVPAEDARGILPTNIHTNIIAKFNLRTLSEMARSRTGARTQDEYREVMDLMLNCVVALHPWTKPFLFPEAGAHAKALEAVVDELNTVQALTPHQRLTMLKHIDALRKGGS
jgi:flavin-dependent thymidylate synthase